VTFHTGARAICAAFSAISSRSTALNATILGPITSQMQQKLADPDALIGMGKIVTAFGAHL
jgi:hypothetical protein